MQSTSTFDKVLKEFYVDKLPELVNQRVKVKEHFQKRSGGDMSVDGRQVVYPLHIGRNVGVGAVAEGANLPTAGAQQYISMAIPFRFNYGRIQLTSQAMKQSQTSKGAFRKAVDEEISRSAKDVGREINRQLWSYGNGILCLVNGAITNSTTVTVDASGGFANANNGARFLRVGDIIAFISAAGALVAVRTITAIAADLASITVDSAVTLADNVFVVRCATTGSTSVDDTAYGKEVMGLPGLIDDGTYVATYFGNSRTTYPVLKAHAASSVGDLSLTKIQQAFDAAEQKGNGSIKAMWAHHSVRRAYLALLSSFRQYQNEWAKKPDGGFKGAALDFDIEYAEVPMKTDRDCPYGMIFGVDDSQMFRYHLTEGEWADDDGKILLRVAGKDAYEARYRVFDNYVCDAPNTCFVMSGINLAMGDSLESIQNV